MGPIATGLGEIYMYTVEYENPHGKGAVFMPGKAGWQKEGVYLTPEGRTLTSNLELASYLREVQDWIIRPQLKGVKDVAGVDAIGGYVKQYHIQPDPMKLVSYGLSFAEVIDAIEKNNLSTGAGYVEHKGESYLVRATGRIESPSQIAEIVVASRGGVPIRVKDIVQGGGAGIGIGRELRTGSASENGEEVVVATAIMLLGANSRTVAASVDAKMTQVQRSLPPGIHAKTVLNRTKLVDATIATVQKNLLEGAVLVIVVLLLLLGNVRAGNPPLDADDRDGHGQGPRQRQPHVAGRDRLRADRRRRGHHRRELPEKARRSSAPQGPPAHAAGTPARSHGGREGDDPALGLRAGDHRDGLLPDPRADRR
jgi:cobalt-zinc-cadmium resistance protein CzcA